MGPGWPWVTQGSDLGSGVEGRRLEEMTSLRPPRLPSPLKWDDPPARLDPLTVRVGATFRAAPAQALVWDCVYQGLHTLGEAEGLLVDTVISDLGQYLLPSAGPLPLSICLLPWTRCLHMP